MTVSGEAVGVSTGAGSEVEPRGLELTLYVSGASGLSARAIANARAFCDSHLAEPFAFSVIDINEDLDALLSSGVIAVPTLVKSWPLPVRKLVGDLSHPEKVLTALGLPPVGPTPTRAG